MPPPLVRVPIAHNVPAVYDGLTARIANAKHLQGRQNVPEQRRGNGAKRDHSRFGGRGATAAKLKQSRYVP
jgi:hypothetical protein